MEKIIDLHVHTNISDGALTPKEVIDEAANNNVSVLAIADHDIIDAYTDDLFNYAKEKKIEIIPAVEISTKTKKCGIHVLGYNIDINSEKLKNKLFELRNIRHKYLHDVSKALNNIGYKIDTDELDKIEAVTKAHIARDVIKHEENKDLLMKDFGHIPEMGEFIETIMNEGCKAYVKKDTVSPKDAANIIRAAGGKVVLAHPVAYKHEDNLTDEDILELVKETKADAIEANYIYINRDGVKINEVEKWNKFAKENGLLTTIGSDFHNFNKNSPIIGLINEDINLTNEEIEKILNNLK